MSAVHRAVLLVAGTEFDLTIAGYSVPFARRVRHHYLTLRRAGLTRSDARFIVADCLTIGTFCGRFFPAELDAEATP
jgi:hypothetical protein